MYQVNINSEWCKSCLYCLHFCPKKCFRQNTEFNALGYHPVFFSDRDKCTGCGICYQMCPELCIEIVSEPAPNGG